MAEIKPASSHPQGAKPSYRVVIDKDKCKSCRLCIAYCPKKLLTLSKDLNKKGLLYVIKNKGECLGCGACILMCPDSCIRVIKE